MKNCPLCRAQSFFFTHCDQRDYNLCPLCSLIFVSPEFFVSREEEIKRYSLHQNSIENVGYVKMFQEKIDIINQICPQIKSALDYGCGADMVLKTLLSRRGYKVDGYDPLFWPDNKLLPSYGLVISTETFEHFQNPREEVDRISALLAPSGFVAIMTRFYSQETSITPAQFSSWYYKKDPTHVAFYNTATFDWLALHMNCQIVFNNQKDFVVLQSCASSNT